jgi:hypothetical protein
MAGKFIEIEKSGSLPLFLFKVQVLPSDTKNKGTAKRLHPYFGAGVHNQSDKY